MVTSYIQWYFPYDSWCLFVNKKFMYHALSLQELTGMAMCNITTLKHSVLIIFPITNACHEQHAFLWLGGLWSDTNLKKKSAICLLRWCVGILGYVFDLFVAIRYCCNVASPTNDKWVWCTEPELLWCLIIWSLQQKKKVFPVFAVYKFPCLIPVWPICLSCYVWFLVHLCYGACFHKIHRASSKSENISHHHSKMVIADLEII